MQVRLWSDYVCPWCYLGRDRTVYLIELGVELEVLPYELHPEIPAHGTVVRPGGRLAAVLTTIGDECAEVGLPFVMPERIPRSRRALETAAVVRRDAPEAFARLDRDLFEAVFVNGLDIADQEVLDRLVGDAGAPPDRVRSSVHRGDGGALVAASMDLARDHGVAGTPAWLFAESFVLPGVQPRELYQRVVARLRAHDAVASGPETSVTER